MIDNKIQKKRFEEIFFQSWWVNQKVSEILEFQSWRSMLRLNSAQTWQKEYVVEDRD